MRVLYAIQGTGNGHLSRANDIVPILQKKVNLDIMISGIQADVSVPFEIKYKCKGMSFIFGKNGGVAFWDTFIKNNLLCFRKEIHDLPVHEYDLVISDFEPISAWAAQFKKVPCIGLSHQAAVLHKNSPKPEEKSWFGETILNHYAPAKQHYGFHFEKYDDQIFTPVIRQQLRDLDVKNYPHFTVYLPAFGDKQIIHALSRFKDIKWEVFSKHSKIKYVKNNVFITPIHNERFLESMATSSGVLCGAGFETPAEALFLEKKLMVIPMKSQYEQQCNAAALKKLGVAVIPSLQENQLSAIENWLHSKKAIPVNYPDNTESILDQILEAHCT